MNIEIKNCNNIDYANIILNENKLNIKFAPNGTGKSSLARALLTKGDQNRLNELMPFKLRKENPKSLRPEVNGAESLNNVMCFNEDYVNQFIFKQDELINDSFNIFIRTEKYKEIEQKIDSLTHDIKQLFIGNQDLESLIETLKKMGSAFTLTKTGVSKSSSGGKALSVGNKILYVPPGLESYAMFIQSPNSVNWIDWQTKGYEFADLSDNCPFCTSHTADKKDQIKRVGKEYDKNVIKNLIYLIDIIDKLGEFFSDEAKEKLNTITTLKGGLEKEHERYLVELKGQIDGFTEKLEKLRTISGFQFRDGEKVGDKLPEYKLSLQFFEGLNSEKMREAIAPINSSIDRVIEKASLLQGEINKQRLTMKQTIDEHQKSINSFLICAGYRYIVEIAGEGEQSQLRLRHVEHEEHLKGGNQYLSFGERNAFSIILFMYECLAKKPDLIILDDPISSFDKNKKYAILEWLFRRGNGLCLVNKTVLMLTHDIEPLIDTIKSLGRIFGGQTTASFLKQADGNVSEHVITKDDIQTFAEICAGIIASSKDNIIKLIYLRRLYEITDDKGDAYQVLSNIFHKRDRPTDSREPSGSDGKSPEMDVKKFTNGCSEIEKRLGGFSYSDSLKEVDSVNAVKVLYKASTVGYEKLQLFRLLGCKVDDHVVNKFINETYHIENEFICQLDPTKFDMIPGYVINECNKMVDSL